MKLSLLIVHYDAPSELERCLRSVAETGRGLDLETIVVDNASDPRDLPGRFPSPRWLLNHRNEGFGRAVNRAAAEATGDVLVCLNPDAELLPGALQALGAFFGKATEPVGAVGGELLFPDGTWQPSCGPFPGLANLVLRRALPPHRRRNYLTRFSEPRRVDWVSGAFFGIRRAVFERVGGFDPGFFLYYEDVDLCRRLDALGCPCYALPQARARHHNPHALRRGRDPRLEAVIRESRLRYFAKHRPAWERWALERIS